MERTTDDEIQLKYRHFTERKIPFEDEIVDIAFTDGINYSERDRWLKNLYFITKRGYYIKYRDFYAPNTYFDDEDDQPFVIYLEGVLKAAFVYAFTAELEDTIRFILKFLAEGKICVTRYIYGPHLDKYHFAFTQSYYSYIPAEERNN